MKALVSMRAALTDPALLGQAIAGESWQAWRVLLIASMGEELNDQERLIFHTLTGREREPLELVEEIYGIAGRRSGKTRAAGVLAAYVGCLCEHSAHLAAGERGVLPILAASTVQAERAFQHTLGVLRQSPILRDMIDGTPTSDTIRLSTRVDVQVRPANFRTIRGITAVAAVADEVAFWFLDGSANSDAEILNALRPALATTGGPLMVISSPYAKRGELYGAYRRDYGAQGDPRVLVAKGPSRTFNPTLPQAVIDRAYARDAAAAAAEYGGEFRNDIEQFISREAVEGCVATGVYELAPAAGLTYLAFADPSGGAVDSMTLAIGHRDGQRIVLDAVRERRPPFSPEQVVTEFCDLLKSYRVRTVTGDRWGGEFVRQPFGKQTIEYKLSEHTRSDLYRDMLPMLNSGRVELLDNPKLVLQIASLERRVARGGRESIDHAPGAHDDLANAVAGLVSLCAKPVQRVTFEPLRI
jgi:hypothetical protein